jgi:ABC-type glycerol-3-phosphate transport system permease component
LTTRALQREGGVPLSYRRSRARLSLVLPVLLRHLLLVLLTLAVLVPFAWILVSSLKTLPEFFRFPPTFWPQAPTLDHYLYVLTRYDLIKRFYVNSLIITPISVLMTVSISVLAGYGFARFKFRFRDQIFWLMILSLYFPTGITSIFAIFELTSAMGLQDTKTGVILPYTALHLPIYMFVMHTIFKQIPRELEEAASIDGASPYETFWRIMLPLSATGIVVITILAFTAIWGEYLLARTLTSDNAMPIGVGLTAVQTNMGDTEFPILAAAYVGAIVPPIVIFAVLQRWFMRGLLAGALKF